VWEKEKAGRRGGTRGIGFLGRTPGQELLPPGDQAGLFVLCVPGLACPGRGGSGGGFPLVGTKPGILPRLPNCPALNNEHAMTGRSVTATGYWCWRVVNRSWCPLTVSRDAGTGPHVCVVYF
jgi:hypothetical protein